jgi:hypothetical protein
MPAPVRGVCAESAAALSHSGTCCSAKPLILLPPSARRDGMKHETETLGIKALSRTLVRLVRIAVAKIAAS